MSCLHRLQLDLIVVDDLALLLLLAEVHWILVVLLNVLTQRVLSGTPRTLVEVELLLVRLVAALAHY